MYVDELKTVAKLAIAALAHIESILLWRWPVLHHSVVVFVGFQLLVSYPHFLPASWPSRSP